VPVAAAVPATTLPAADPDASAPAGDAAQGVPVATTLARPALPAFQPGAPRPPSPADAKPAKDDAKSDTPPALDTSEPQGILPPPDKPNPLAASVRKDDTAPAPQHRSATELHAALSDSRPANQDSLLDPATFGATSGTAAAAGVSHASAATDASGSTASSAAQNQIQLQQPVPLSGVPVLIATRALAGDKHFEIRLDPPELGRIEVRLKVDRDGQLSSHVIADRSDTLTLLRRDGAGLERALQDAGFKTAGDGLQFSLRDQSGHGQQDSRPAPQPLAADQDTTARLDAVPGTYMRYSGRAGGLDIRV
jgi:flagellar hook-length control protein FliK